MHAHNDVGENEYVPPKQPDGYPYGADRETKIAFHLSRAPKLTAERKATLRALLMGDDA